IRVAVARAGEPSVFVVLNDEIHAPRSVTKTHTLRLGAFQSPWFGPLGYVDGPHVNVTHVEGYSRARPFGRDLLRRLPRVDVVYSHVGADGHAIRSFVAVGSKGIVSAGFGPGMAT